MQPGDRKTLPRIPMVEIKERKRVRVAKAPFRAVGLMVGGVGLAIRSVGHGVAKLGDLAVMGPSSEWVPEADVGANGKKIDWFKRFDQEHKDRLSKIERAQAGAQSKSVVQSATKVFNEKGEKLWKDDDSIASTRAGSDEEEVLREKEFC